MGKTNLWWQLWVTEYAADTNGLTHEEKGIYVDLLNIYWRQQSPLVDDDKRLAKRLGITMCKWKKVKENFDHLFVSENGLLHHKYMDERIQRARRLSETRAAAGRVGGEAKAHRVANAKQMPEKPQAEIVANAKQTPRKLKLKSELEELSVVKGGMGAGSGGAEQKTGEQIEGGGSAEFFAAGGDL